MSVTADQERRYYDQAYAPHLEADDGELRIDRHILAAQFDDPASPWFERRLLYRTALEKLLAEPVKGRRVLDYGCGVGDWGVVLAVEGAGVTLLDLSPVAVEVALRRARASGVAECVRGFARDASDLGCFADGEFDLIFACGRGPSHGQVRRRFRGAPARAQAGRTPGAGRRLGEQSPARRRAPSALAIQPRASRSR